MAYCSTSDVTRYLPPEVVVEGDNPTPDPFDSAQETVQLDDITEYIVQADQIINGQLSTIHIVPLRQVNFGGTVGYPHPIPQISARIAAKLLWERALSGADRQHGEFIMTHYAQAMDQLQDVLTGHVRLLGHEGQMGSVFSRSSWHSVPPSPAREAPDFPK